MSVLPSPLPMTLAAAAAGQRHVVDESLGTGRVREVDRDRGLDSVDAARTGGGFIDHIADIVDHIGVVAAKAAHGVGAAGAVERVGGDIAGKRIGQRIACCVDGRGADQRHMFDHASGMGGIRETEVTEDITRSVPFDPAALSSTMSPALSTV